MQISHDCSKQFDAHLPEKADIIEYNDIDQDEPSSTAYFPVDDDISDTVHIPH